MSSDSLEKASQQFSLRGFTTDLPSFCFWWGGSLGVSSSSAASSCLGIDTPWSDEQHHHFTPNRGAGISNPLGMETVSVSSLPATACGWVPVKSCKCYIIAPQHVARQAHKAAMEASTKAWWSHPSSAIASCPSANILFLWICCKTQELVVWCASASLIPVGTTQPPWPQPCGSPWPPW